MALTWFASPYDAVADTIILDGQQDPVRPVDDVHAAVQ